MSEGTAYRCPECEVVFQLQLLEQPRNRKQLKKLTIYCPVQATLACLYADVDEIEPEDSSDVEAPR